MSDRSSSLAAVVTTAWLHNRAMPNISTALKAEISRIARKELRSEVDGIKKAASGFRSDVAALKRRAQALERGLRRLGKSGPKVESKDAADFPSRPLRFSAKGLATHRQRLGLSAEDCGVLVGTSGQSIYNWESGKARPRAKFLASIATLKAMGKKEAAARLLELRESAESS